MNHKAIGTISLSHKNIELSSARVGLWIASANRRKAIALNAALLVSEVALKLGISDISFSISENNIAAKGLAKKCGAQANYIYELGKTIYSIKLKASNKRRDSEENSI